MLLEIIVATVITALVLYWAQKKQREREEAAERVFRATMLSLEEKAKREGTFKRSYFDEGDKS